MSQDDQAFIGPRRPSDGASQYRAMRFVIDQVLRGTWTITLVQVIAVHPATLTCDIQPCVHQVDGLGKATPHGTIFGAPYFRLQGGLNAIICDPVAGDIGMAGFASRDLSSVIANKAPSNPGSSREFDPSDALYLGGFLNAVPTQSVQFGAGGITITSTGTITLVGNVNVTGTLSVGGTVVTVP